jgi:putative transposase
VSWRCEALEVSESGYHAWAVRPPSEVRRRHAELVAVIAAVHAEVRGRYGSPRMTAELNARGHACSENTVAELMKRHGIRARAPRRFVRTTNSRHDLPVFENRLDRDFDPEEPNASWCAEHDQRLLAEAGIVCSMSGVAQCWDNAPVESFFASLKRELVHDENYTTREQAKASIFEFIETFYNRVRRHSSLGFVSPVEFERAHNQKHP